MTIQTVTDNGQIYEVTLTDGTVQWVPKNAQNADYMHVQAWVAGGGSIAAGTGEP